MKLLHELQSNPTFFLALVISIVIICIIVMIIIILYKLESEKRVTKAALELKKITNSIRAGLVHFVLEDNCKILYASRGFYDLLGYSRKEAKSENKLSLLDFIDPRDRSICSDNWLQSVGDSISLEIRMITKEGKSLVTLINGNIVQGRDGRHTISAVFVDISEQKQMQEMLMLEGERYRVATELSNDVLFEYDIKKDEIIYTGKYKDLFGENTFIPDFNASCELRRDYIHPNDWGIYLEFCAELAEGKAMVEAEFRRKNKMGEYIWCQSMGKTIYDDDKNPIRVIGKIVNVDVHKRELEALEYKATRDPLTGVYNKEVTIKKIDKFISGNKNGRHILMLIDFDDFKKVNDTYGHLHGDKVLVYVIGRIKSVFNEGEIIGRVGGDEFVVFAGNVTDIDDILKKADALIEALDTTYIDGGNEIPISGSIGIASYPEDGLHYEQLLDCADKALYKVKEQGKNNYMIYTSII
ncbi:diguanylate cyclase [Mobilitalea sibirica]|uniref:Diguanylate cyclase n=1 Tax=Mobilitalea sibirica TaxID=1462919 RepID=A0A8J7H1C1_9FIRM|nr:diguanylate cyclase [Mobilitalea sibirica]MBH1940138.1 diguanylate cyclase [Mobilitalea sibirica]